VTRPVWDGDGRDPWLPARLDARLEAARVERDIRAAVWAALSDWLVQTARRVLRGDMPPDLDAIWARVPAWSEAVDLILSGEVAKALALAFEKLLGRTFDWTQRPAMTGYLAEARNRLVRIPDEVYDLVAGEIAAGANLGESIPKLAARVDNVLSTTASERWPNRATVIARTETIGALNAGRADAFSAVADDLGQPMEKLWLATSDSRTRRTHGGRWRQGNEEGHGADGQRVPVGSPFIVGGFPLAFPGDPTGPAQEVIQCRCTMLLVEPGESVDLSNRQFRGDR
jgi:Phage Mu protein F like protein